MNRLTFRMPHGTALFLLAALALLAGACGNGSDPAPPSAAGAPPPQVTALRLEPRTVAVPIELNGRLEGSREVEVRARVSGILLERAYAEGRPVKKGHLLFVIDPAPYRAEVQAAEAKLTEERARLSRAEREVARLEPLLAERAASRRDYDNAVSEAELAKAATLSAQARLDQAKLDLAYTRVEAPISGLSSRALHSEGSLVGPGESGLLTRLSQVQPMWVRFSAPDQTLLALRTGVANRSVTSPGTDRLEVELVLADGTVYPERGRVNFSDSLIDAATGNVELRAEVPNAAADLIPGQFVRVRLLGIERPGALLLPQRAVLQGAQGKFVLVVGAGNLAEVKPVEVGDWLGADWIIRSGLAAGDLVIVDGVMKVQPGNPVEVVEPPAPTTAPASTPGAAS